MKVRVNELLVKILDTVMYRTNLPMVADAIRLEAHRRAGLFSRGLIGSSELSFRRIVSYALSCTTVPVGLTFSVGVTEAVSLRVKLWETRSYDPRTMSFLSDELVYEYQGTVHLSDKELGCVKTG